MAAEVAGSDNAEQSDREGDPEVPPVLAGGAGGGGAVRGGGAEGD